MINPAETIGQIKMNITALSGPEAARMLAALRAKKPLVHCLTNEVVQEITADVLLAAGASPAMVVAEEEAAYFAGAADAVLVNIGTPYPARLRAMHASAAAARAAGKPWVLDPVAAGGIPWRDGVIAEFVRERPDVIRGNASEILALAGKGKGGKGVDSTDDSSAAVEAAAELARRTGSVVGVTGATDYITDGERVLSVPGGHPMATLVVGTGCSLSALVAAFCGASSDHLTATAAACALAKKAAEAAALTAKGPGSFHDAYLDALWFIKPEDFSGKAC
jgi:hydroxyethylthiazole kinase